MWYYNIPMTLDTQLIKAVARLEAKVEGLDEYEIEEYIIDRVGDIYQLASEMYDETKSLMTHYDINVMLLNHLEELKGGK